MAFRDLEGHSSLLRVVSRAIAQGTLPPSLILAGPDGVGKATVAVAIAQALNCERPAPARVASRGADTALDVDACGDCPTCRRIETGQFSEVIALAPEESGAIKIDPVRAALQRTGFRPFEGRRRVIWVDGADALVVPAQHALLKSLEEPGPSTVFLLVTGRPDALLPTVRSRCPQLRFGPLPPEAVAGVLVRRHGWDPARARAAAGAAGGSVGAALASADGAFETARTVAETVLRRLAAPRDARVRLEASRLLAERGGSGSRGGRGAVGRLTDRALVGERLAALGLLLRDLGAMASDAAAEWVANVDRRSLLSELGQSYDARRAVRAFAAVDAARQALDRNVSPKVVADWVAFQL